MHYHNFHSLKNCFLYSLRRFALLDMKKRKVAMNML